MQGKHARRGNLELSIKAIKCGIPIFQRGAAIQYILNKILHIQPQQAYDTLNLKRARARHVFD